MRTKKEKFSIYPHEESDAFAEYGNWSNDDEQNKYLQSTATQIGWIIIEFNRLEWQLHELIKQYLCNDSLETNAIFFETVSSKNFGTKVDLLKNFFQIYYSGEKQHMFDSSENLKEFKIELDKVIKKVKDTAELRNKYAHCYWHRATEDNFVEFKYKITAMDGLRKEFVRFNAEDLKNDYELIEEAQNSLYNFDIDFYQIYTDT